MSENDQSPWYAEGLRFECTQCGGCCRGPGNVWVTDHEIEAIARLIDCEPDTFRAQYVKRSGRRGLVLSQQRNQDCIFWQEGVGCKVYDARPRQCASYPFWKVNLRNKHAWVSERRSCPGVEEGRLHSREEIDALLEDDGIPDHRTRVRIERAKS